MAIQPLVCSYTFVITFLISFRRELSVMHSLRMCYKSMCQNLLVHPKCTLGGSTKFHVLHVLPPPPTHGNGNFSSGLDLENLKLIFGNWFLPTPPCTWEFEILANLDSASKVGNWFPPILPPPPTLHMGIWNFSKFGLSIKSWKLVSTKPPPPPAHENLGF